MAVRSLITLSYHAIASCAKGRATPASLSALSNKNEERFAGQVAHPAVPAVKPLYPPKRLDYNGL